jgi:hypothetical protein
VHFNKYIELAELLEQQLHLLPYSVFPMTINSQHILDFDSVLGRNYYTATLSPYLRISKVFGNLLTSPRTQLIADKPMDLCMAYRAFLTGHLDPVRNKYERGKIFI